MKQVRFRSLHTGIKFWIDGLWLCIDSWNLIRNKISWLLWWSPQTTFLRIFVPWFDISVSIKHWDFLHDTFGKCHLQILTSNEKKNSMKRAQLIRRQSNLVNSTQKKILPTISFYGCYFNNLNVISRNMCDRNMHWGRRMTKYIY